MITGRTLPLLVLLSPLIALLGARGAAAANQCGATYVGSGVVTSPNYPSNYANNTNCPYLLLASPGGNVVLKFSDFALENNFDFLIITSDGMTVGRYTGFTKPPILTLGHSVTLRFTSDFSVVAKGFSVAFSTLAADCGGLIAGSGHVRSPEYPSNYGANLICVWGVVATQGKTVTLDFQSFQLENNYDFLSIYDGESLVARYTGSTLPPSANLGPASRLVFTSDGSVGYAGFSIAAGSAALTCGGLITGELTITSPNYPNNYPANSSCTWTYYVQSEVLGLNFRAFNLEGNNYDTVKLYNGQTLLNTYTGNATPGLRILTPGPITVVFTSDGTIQYSGFRLTFILWFDKK